MSLELPSVRATNPTASPAPAQPQGVAGELLAPIDHLHDALAGGLVKLDRVAEARTARVPLLGQLVQFGTGAGSALLGLVDGTWQMLRHPLQTLEGLWGMASHVPLTPMWLLRGLKGGFGATLAQDKAFWGAVVGSYFAPYKRDWQAGRYFAVAGRATVDLASLYLTVRQAQRALQGWHTEHEALTQAGLASTGEDGVGTASAGASTDLEAARRAPKLLHGQTRGEKMLGDARSLQHPTPALPAKPGTTGEIRAAAKRFAGGRTDVEERAMVQLRQDRTNFMRINRVGADRLRTDAMVRTRYKFLTDSVEKRMNQEMGEILGITPEGAAKDPMRAAAKLDLLTPKQGKDFRLGNLDDLTRGRINLPNLDVKEMKDILQTLKEHFGRKNMIIHDYISGKPFYRGRLHVKVRDGSGMWYELQVGPKQISAFYDTPFKLAGKTANIHDTVYKGLLQFNDDAMTAVGDGSLAVGKQRVATVLNQYVDQVDQVVAVARKGGDFDFATTANLREALDGIVRKVPEALRPVGLH